MFKNRVVSGLLLIVFVVLSYIVLIQYVTPLVIDVTSSDLYIEETDDYASVIAKSTPMTEIASTFCFNELAEEYDTMTDIDVSKVEHTAWSMGGYHYIVKANIPANQSPDNLQHIMVCEISYDSASQAPNTPENWNVTGLSFNVPDNQPEN